MTAGFGVVVTGHVGLEVTQEGIEVMDGVGLVVKADDGPEVTDEDRIERTAGHGHEVTACV